MSTSYAGHAFHDSFPGGRASGELMLTDTQVIFRNNQGSVQFSIRGARFKLGGASDRLLFISHPAQPDWNLYTSDLGILKHPALQQDPQVKQQVRKARRGKQLAWGVFGSLAALVVAIPLCILLFMDSITGVLAPHVPAQWEQKMGATALGQVQTGTRFMPRDQSRALLQPLVDPLLNALDSDRYEYEFHISADDQINAFALPGGYIVINSGLILKADNAAEVLGVVAHEIAHVTQQHGVRNIMGTAGIYVTLNALLGDMSGLLGVMVDAAPFLINQSYSRGFEAEADEQGLALLRRARIDPRGLVSFFEKLQQIERERLQEMGADDSDTVESPLDFLNSPPATADRIANLQQRIAALPPQEYVDLETEFNRLQQQVRQFVAAEDPTQQGDPTQQ